MRKNAGDRDLLRLTAGGDKAFLVKFAADHCIEPMGKAGVIGIKLCICECIPDSLVICFIFRPPHQHVLGKRHRKYLQILEHGAKALPVSIRVDPANVRSVDEDRPFRNRIESHQKLDEGRFPRTVVADDRQLFPFLPLKAHVSDRGSTCTRIRKSHILKLYGTDLMNRLKSGIFFTFLLQEILQVLKFSGFA